MRAVHTRPVIGLSAGFALLALLARIVGLGVAAWIVGIACVVIMNVMLATVTERTREIGIRKSLGARSTDIMMQFLTETAVMSALGGMIGVAVAYAFAMIVSATTPVPMQVSLTAVISALCASTAVGVFFGVYPARSAASLHLLAALRQEV